MADDYATDSEVEAAIRALSDADAIRLAKAGDLHAQALKGLGLGISGEDLLQEAIVRTVDDGRRKWRKSKVTVVKHLRETMRSIANHAPDELKGATVVAATGEDQKGYLDGVALRSRLPDIERVAAAHEQLDRINRRFADDTEVGLILQGLATGMSGPEIQADLGISENDYETIMTRLRRGVDREEGWRP